MLRDRLYGLLGIQRSGRPARAPTLTRPAPFARLKAGSKSAIIAVVDNGTVSYQRFGDTDFGVLPWVGDGFAA
jgi:tRNA-splicing endonuclease subunit Sen54